MHFYLENIIYHIHVFVLDSIDQNNNNLYIINMVVELQHLNKIMALVEVLVYLLYFIILLNFLEVMAMVEDILDHVFVLYLDLLLNDF